MGQVIAVTNQKGGVGKTTTCINLGYSFSLLGRNTLLIDLDPQANSTSGVGVSDPEATVVDVFNGKPFPPILISDNLYLIPSSTDLLGIEVELVNVSNREFVLRRELESMKHKFDIILLDTPPSLGLLSVNALTAADFCLVPVQAEYYALEGLASINRTIQFIQKTTNPDLAILGFVVTMFDNRTVLSKQVFDEVKRNFKELVFDIKIPRSVRVAEAPSFGKPLLQYDPTNLAGLAYLNLADQLIQRLESKQLQKKASNS